MRVENSGLLQIFVKFKTQCEMCEEQYLCSHQIKEVLPKVLYNFQEL